MADKLVKLGLERDYKKYLYFIDGTGSVCRKLKSGTGEAEVLHLNVVQRDSKHLYYIDKDGDVACSMRGTRKQVATTAVAPSEPEPPQAA